MARHRSSRRHRVKRGGGNYSSASSYGGYVNGSGDSQFSRTFDQTGANSSRIGTQYVGAQGQGSVTSSLPSAQNLSLVQSAGKSRRSRRKRGGLLGSVLNQAIVPFGLLGLQQSYRRKRGGSHTRKHKR